MKDNMSGFIGLLVKGTSVSTGMEVKGKVLGVYVDNGEVVLFVAVYLPDEDSRMTHRRVDVIRMGFTGNPALTVFC